MKRADITTALKDRLADAALGLPIAFPNVGFDPAMTPRPYLEVQWPAARRTGGMQASGFLDAGEVEREFGRMSVSVVAHADKDPTTGVGGEGPANDHADDIAGLFPEGLVLPITGGEITITKPADIRGGYRDDADWRVPVIIEYDALSR